MYYDGIPHSLLRSLNLNGEIEKTPAFDQFLSYNYKRYHITLPQCRNRRNSTVNSRHVFSVWDLENSNDP